jgi:hypothetical protein
MKRLILPGVLLLSSLVSVYAEVSSVEGLKASQSVLLPAAQFQAMRILGEEARSCLGPSLEALYNRLFFLQDQRLKAEIEAAKLGRVLPQNISYFRFYYPRSPLASKSDVEIVEASMTLDPRREGNLQLEKIEAFASSKDDKDKELKGVEELIKTVEAQIDGLLEKIQRN